MKMRLMGLVMIAAVVCAGAGCGTISTDLVVEQVTSENKNAEAARRLAESIEVNYTGPAKAKDESSIKAGLAKDVATQYGKVDAATYNAWYDDAKAKADAAIAVKKDQHDAVTTQLRDIASRSEMNATVAKEIAKKVNGK